MIRNKLVRQTLTVARRDFIATVFTPTFLIFLLAPLIMLSFGAVGGIGAATMASSSADKSRIVAIASPADARALIAADRNLRGLYRRREGPPALVIQSPGGDEAAQARRAFDAKDTDPTAVLYGPLSRPTVLHVPVSVRHADYLARLAEEALRSQRLGGETRLSVATKQAYSAAAGRTSQRGSNQAAFFAVFGLFILTLMLAGQAVGTMAEERSNKVIEVLAAAVPLESVFLGKLLGMFGVAILFVAFWGTIVVNVGQLLPGNFARAFAEVGPAVGPLFALLFFGYFTMAYLLLGSVFLGIGAQASTPREIQMLSLPITIFQVAMFGLSQAAATNPDSGLTRFAEIFPFSSPFAMAARAANKPEIWPHLLALGWQALWVAATIWLGARLFRRGVLQSGSPAFWKRGRTAKTLEAGSHLPA
ncbi:ABC-2 type transport system permease protein [Sphingomonas guangdongensis]|uniref:ABC-2 type transport system permease protein n=1 Tax=Sphingomonas guangdongensis TaxID=1141890 RepID=A0A285Q9R9_9SPHN|nr:ABC transporter permease [Sphingomonas guangdongensis]SOB78613.1 ABC-2 type transport system permease protein [Sphingomonas guangdongensis]